MSRDTLQFGPKLRPVLADFAVEMEKKLIKNDHKTGWRTYPIEALMRLLQIEYNELQVAVEFNIGDAASECLDIANFAMMLRDRLLNPPKQPNGVASDANHYETELHARNLDP